MAEIYADMFIADQWVYDHNLRYTTDTTAVYDPIFKKYGYTVEDFRYTVDQYLNDADRFSKVLEKSKYILQSKMKQVDLKINRQYKLDSLNNANKELVKKFILWNIPEEKELDSLRQVCFPLFPIIELDSLAYKDTTYVGPKIEVIPYKSNRIRREIFSVVPKKSELEILPAEKLNN